MAFLGSLLEVTNKSFSFFLASLNLQALEIISVVIQPASSQNACTV